MYKIDVPYRVVINEGVELAKSFGADGSHKYVNGVLDKVAQELRKIEIAAKKAK
jgi:N utilization substance protein B